MSSRAIPGSRSHGTPSSGASGQARNTSLTASRASGLEAGIDQQFTTRSGTGSRPPMFPNITRKDVVIAIMGVTGSGKSTFISSLMQENIGIGHELTSCTNEVGVYNFQFGNRKIFLIDTPGFDDTLRSDTEVLTDVACFLSAAYQDQIRLSGIIYLHRITDVRLTGTALKNLSMFKKLCGDDYFKNVILATTMWGNLEGGELTPEVGERREEELVENKAFWGFMMDRGSRISRHSGTRDSALAIVSSLIGLPSRPVLDIQREMVDENKKVSDTAAGMEVQRELLAVQAKHKSDIAELAKSHEEALKNRDEELAGLIVEERKKCEALLQKANEDTEKLQVDFKTLKEDKEKESKELLERVKKEKEAHEKELNLVKSQIKGYQTKHDRNEKELLKMKERCDALAAETERLRQAESSISGAGLLGMVVGLGTVALSALTLNPVGVAGGVSLFAAGAGAQAQKGN